MTKLSDKAGILDYWRAVEFFSPQNIPRVAPNDKDEPVFSVREGEPLPWEPDHKLRFRPVSANVTRRFLVYCGIYRLEKARDILENKIGKDPAVFDERSGGESCLFAFSVTDDGRPLFDTFILSTCAWATARTLDPGPNSANWLEGFDSCASALATSFAERLEAEQDEALDQEPELDESVPKPGRQLGYADIFQETKRIAQELGIPQLSENFEIRIKTLIIPAKSKDSADSQDFLNSFFIQDLKKVATELRMNTPPGKGLLAYLTGDGELDLSKRVDVRKSTSTLFRKLSPALFPPGRWPGKGHYPLVFSQQFAVNSMVRDLMHGSGLFAVNGPPGTGKTTLLRDLIAAVVVERATRIAALARPEHAFSDKKGWTVGKYPRAISTWKDEFKGFEIVVASSNNGAVENVTLELPGKEAVDPAWSEHPGYFPDFAARLIGQPAWALVAARLGSKKNRNEFKSRFWYESKEAGAKMAGDPSASGFLNHLKILAAQPLDWAQAVRRFKDALAQEQHLRAERQQLHETYVDLFNISREIQTLEIKLGELTAGHQPAISQLHEAEADERRLAGEANEARNRRLEHRRFRPGILEIIFTLGRAFREWRGKDKTLESLMDQASQDLAEAKRRLTARQQTVTSLEEEIRRITAKIDQNKRMAATARDCLDKARERFGAHFPLPAMWEQETESRELSSPWADAEWNKARVRVFFEALQLHKAFIIANADTMRKNLHGAMDILDGVVPKTAPAEAVEAAWASLFFVIPVISTTFASFDRLFNHLGRESIGWLLIDEAGQSAPQAAAGAIWRAKRSVVVGDPLQLEPVLTIPFTVQHALRRHYKVDKIWLPGGSSVQQMTDRGSELGTYLNGPDGPLWVGSPLRVHRRCARPMFDISNKIAYDGLMVFGTASGKDIPLPPSRWLHVESMESEGHWIPAEGKAVQSLINELMSMGVAVDNIFLISPFKDVVKRLRWIASGFSGMKAGTIHTVQGKESDVVILVLGGEPRRPGAKQWASARPNLLNVAASRAKQRLYVVGNQDEWERYRYFGTCATILRSS